MNTITIQAELKRSINTYRLQIKESRQDAAKLIQEIGLTHGYQCPQCAVELVLEMIPDYTRSEGHWFAAHLLCPKCQGRFS